MIHFFCHFKNRLEMKSHVLLPQVNVQFPAVDPLISFLFTLTSRVSPWWTRIVYSVSGRGWRASNGTWRITTKNDKHNIPLASAYWRTETVISAKTKQYSRPLSSEIFLFLFPLLYIIRFVALTRHLVNDKYIWWKAFIPFLLLLNLLILKIYWIHTRTNFSSHSNCINDTHKML